MSKVKKMNKDVVSLSEVVEAPKTVNENEKNISSDDENEVEVRSNRNATNRNNNNNSPTNGKKNMQKSATNFDNEYYEKYNKEKLKFDNEALKDVKSLEDIPSVELLRLLVVRGANKNNPNPTIRFGAINILKELSGEKPRSFLNLGRENKPYNNNRQQNNHRYSRFGQQDNAFIENDEDDDNNNIPTLQNRYSNNDDRKGKGFGRRDQQRYDQKNTRYSKYNNTKGDNTSSSNGSKYNRSENHQEVHEMQQGNIN